jgi:hypothetical protein
MRCIATHWGILGMCIAERSSRVPQISRPPSPRISMLNANVIFFVPPSTLKLGDWGTNVCAYARLSRCTTLYASFTDASSLVLSYEVFPKYSGQQYPHTGVSLHGKMCRVWIWMLWMWMFCIFLAVVTLYTPMGRSSRRQTSDMY